MVNKLIKHYYDEDALPTKPAFMEPDKTSTISGLSSVELRRMIERLRGERELESLIRDLKRSSGEIESYDQPFKIDTQTPIDQLYHYGILGQKWGVRRFQNEDGTRTPAGKKRDAQQMRSEDHINSRQSKSRAPSGLSNDELKKLNERLQLEKTYKNLTVEQVQKSESFVKRAIQNGGEQALTEFSKGMFLGGAKVLVKEISPQFAELAFKVKDKDKKD